MYPKLPKLTQYNWHFFTRLRSSLPRTTVKDHDVRVLGYKVQSLHFWLYHISNAKWLTPKMADQIISQCLNNYVIRCNMISPSMWLSKFSNNSSIPGIIVFRCELIYLLSLGENTLLFCKIQIVYKNVSMQIKSLNAFVSNYLSIIALVEIIGKQV